jgi:hypothetical protein
MTATRTRKTPAKAAAAKTQPAEVEPRKPAARTSPEYVTKTNVAGFPIGPAEPNQERIGNPVPGHDGYYVRYARGAYDLCARIGEVDGPAWLAVCRHGNSAGADALMGESGAERAAAARKTWCADCAAGTSAAPAPQSAAKASRGRSPNASARAAAPAAEKAAASKAAPRTTRTRKATATKA